eukprot:CAMPEP_0183330838 /NCGR_PEP_ID=MMETSP0164_2-20130417/272_1 /TAXON_ID=221442 /ORGANISM="Coccolithus pelagicus ssp braarudi, Strain PLY182g" /LENGTH=39 /DNA_ID= /DNA_START= /DNA_END= /DNA_ORIENTATION=
MRTSGAISPENQAPGAAYLAIVAYSLAAALAAFSLAPHS